MLWYSSGWFVLKWEYWHFFITFAAIDKTYSWQFCRGYNLLETKNTKKKAVWRVSLFIYVSETL